MSYTSVVLLETGTAYPSRAHGLTPGFLLVFGAHAFNLICFFTVCLHSVFFPQIAHVSLVCPFLILPPVFSNVYSDILIVNLSSLVSMEKRYINNMKKKTHYRNSSKIVERGKIDTTTQKYMTSDLPAPTPK
jgi:hypothetical protein